jgi:hypothetical protein
MQYAVKTDAPSGSQPYSAPMQYSAVAQQGYQGAPQQQVHMGQGPQQALGQSAGQYLPAVPQGQSGMYAQQQQQQQQQGPAGMPVMQQGQQQQGAYNPMQASGGGGGAAYGWGAQQMPKLSNQVQEQLRGVVARSGGTLAMEMFDMNVCMTLSQMHPNAASAALNQIDHADKTHASPVVLIQSTLQQLMN